MKIKKNFITNSFGEKLETHIKSDGKKKKYPAVIFVSGFGQDLHEDSNSFDEIARKLVKIGFLTVQFSFAGKGKSQGDYSETSVSKQAYEIEDIVANVKELKNVDSKLIGILAQSMGVPATIQALPLSIQALVFICGTAQPYKSLTKVFQGRGIKINFSGITRLPRSDGSYTIVKAGFWKDLKKLNLAKKLAKYSYPLLAIHGSLDTKVTEDEVRKTINLYQGEKRLKIFAKGDHGILKVDREVRDEFLQEIVNWMKKTLLR